MKYPTSIPCWEGLGQNPVHPPRFSADGSLASGQCPVCHNKYVTVIGGKLGFHCQPQTELTERTENG